jgi:anti-sigma-K factor RskA
MAINIKEYIDSGILELYVLNQLSPEEVAEVESLSAQHTQIAQEIHEISLGLEKYGRLMSVTPSASVEGQLFNNLPKRTSSNSSTADQSYSTPPSKGFSPLNLILAALTLGSVLLYLNQMNTIKNDRAAHSIAMAKCDSIQAVQQNQYAFIQKINDPSNQIIKLAASEKYAGIDLYLHANKVTKKNILQMIKAPTLSQDQAFQLWALKDGSAPQPMDVFSAKENFVDIGFVDDVKTYAITIEPAGGSQSPTMANLIGTMTVE